MIPDLNEFDQQAEIERITAQMRAALRKLKRRGFIIAVSGGIDSAACAGLAVRAVGSERVYGILLPERDSSSETGDRGQEIVEDLGIRWERQNIEPALDAIGCYRARDEAMRSVVPEYDSSWASKIIIRGGLDTAINRFYLVIQPPGGEVREYPLDLKPYLQIVAATNYKQRIRKSVEYYHADRLNYAVIGTPNRLEYDQGFFVKNGDGAADVKPIAHLYKTQVYALARTLGLPKTVCQATPTTDTYSLAQTQEEFYFALPYEQMDKALWGYENGVSAEDLGRQLNLSLDSAAAVYRDIEQKRRATAYLHEPAITIDPK
ncbi:MAG: NAD(+) synthase [Pseudomonadota bacterium]